jgi:hypothetical protein
MWNITERGAGTAGGELGQCLNSKLHFMMVALFVT